MTLYELAEEYTKALENIRIDEDTGEVIGFEAVEELEDSFEHKAVNCALYLKSLKAEADAIAAEKKALAEREAAAKKKAERLKLYITVCMDSASKDAIQDPRVRLSFRHSQKVDVFDEGKIPQEFIRTKTEPIKTLIASAIKQGIPVPGAKIVGSRSLQVK